MNSKNGMSIGIDLDQAWLEYAEQGKIINQFVAYFDDPAGWWKTNDILETGVVIKEGKPVYYAKNITQEIIFETNKPIKSLNQNLEAVFMPHRRLRATAANPKSPGPQAAPSDDPLKCGFYCQDPGHQHSLLPRTPLALLPVLNRRYWAIFYNFSPFEKNGHFMLLPVRLQGVHIDLTHYLQHMELGFLQDAISLIRKCQNLLIFFNAIGAGASQNHFHYQAIAHQLGSLAIEHSDSDHPIRFIDFDINTPGLAEIVFKHIQFINQTFSGKTSYNLIFTSQKLYLIPREKDHEVLRVNNDFITCFGAVEVAGRLICTEENQFNNVTSEQYIAALKTLSISKEKIDFIKAESIK